MEAIYQSFKNIVEFRIVYISEAHAVDDRRPEPLAQKLKIFEAKDTGQCCTTAEMMMKEENVSIPCLIDNMDNSINTAYNAHPDRVFLVRTDGRLAVAADRGPWGFKPALDKTLAWLRSYKATGKESALPER